MGGYGAVGVITEVELDLDDNVKIERHLEELRLSAYPNYFARHVLDDPACVMHNADLLPPRFDTPMAITWRQSDKPLARKQRFMATYQLPAPDAETFVYDRPLADYFEAAAAGAKNPKAVANWVINNLRAKLSDTNTSLNEVRIKPADIPQLVALVESGKISTKIAQDVFMEMFTSGEAPASIVEKKGLAQVSDLSAIEAFCDEVIAANPRSAQDFKAGKAAALNFLKGQVMKASKGKANPNLVGEILERKLR